MRARQECKKGEERELFYGGKGVSDLELFCPKKKPEMEVKMKNSHKNSTSASRALLFAVCCLLLAVCCSGRRSPKSGLVSV
jgi:hypothetical protein